MAETHPQQAIQEKCIRQAVELLHPTETDWVVARYLEGLLSVTVREQIGAVASALAERDARIAEMEGALEVALRIADRVGVISEQDSQAQHADVRELHRLVRPFAASILNKGGKQDGK